MRVLLDQDPDNNSFEELSVLLVHIIAAGI